MNSEHSGTAVASDWGKLGSSPCFDRSVIFRLPWEVLPALEPVQTVLRSFDCYKMKLQWKKHLAMLPGQLQLGVKLVAIAYLVWLQGIDFLAVCHLLATCGGEGRVKVVSHFNVCPWNSTEFASGAAMFIRPLCTSVFLKALLICSEIPCDDGGNRMWECSTEMGR